jgi:PEGA domain-containing protein
MTQQPTTSPPSGKAYPGSNKGILAGGDDDFDRVIEETFAIRAALGRRRKIVGAAIALLVVAGLGLTAAFTDAGRGLLQSGSALVRGDSSRPSNAAAPAQGATPTAHRSTAPASTRSSGANRRTALLSVTSTPRAALFIDGKRIGETPVGGHALTVGRTYQIRLEQKGYQTKRETISVSNTRAIRSHYVLTRARTSKR